MEKRDVKPFIDSGIKDTIYKISFITGYSVKNICEDLCTHAITSGVGKELSIYFKRGLKLEGVVYPGNKQAEKFESKSTNSERISMKVNNQIYEYAYSLSYAIGCSVAKVIAYFVERSMRDFNFLDCYVSSYLSDKMEVTRRRLLQKIMERVNEELEDDHSISSLLIHIVDEYKRPQDSVKMAVDTVSQEVVKGLR